MSEKIILTDCDGVLLNWNRAFSAWMEAKGHVLQNDHTYDISDRYGISRSEGHQAVLDFNSSPEVGFLPIQDDALRPVRQLSAMGYGFLVTTSLSDDPIARSRRIKNLEMTFGKNIFLDAICLPLGASKEPYLEAHRDSGRWWIEDKPENAVLGRKMGLNAVLYNQPNNKHFETNIPRVSSWRDIFSMVVGQNLSNK